MYSNLLLGLIDYLCNNYTANILMGEILLYV